MNPFIFAEWHVQTSEHQRGSSESYGFTGDLVSFGVNENGVDSAQTDPRQGLHCDDIGRMTLYVTRYRDFDERFNDGFALYIPVTPTCARSLANPKQWQDWAKTIHFIKQNTANFVDYGALGKMIDITKDVANVHDAVDHFSRINNASSKPSTFAQVKAAYQVVHATGAKLPVIDDIMGGALFYDGVKQTLNPPKAIEKTIEEDVIPIQKARAKHVQTKRISKKGKVTETYNFDAAEEVFNDMFGSRGRAVERTVSKRRVSPPRRDDTFLCETKQVLKQSIKNTWEQGDLLSGAIIYADKGIKLFGTGVRYIQENEKALLNADNIFGPLLVGGTKVLQGIGYASELVSTGMRRGLRDYCGVSQGNAQDIADVGCFVADLLATRGAGKAAGVASKFIHPVAHNKLLWTSWRHYPKVMVNGREYAKIGKRLWSRHAVDRSLPSSLTYLAREGRSFPPNLVEEVIRNGTKTQSLRGIDPRIVHKLGLAEVVTDATERVVITINPIKDH